LCVEANESSLENRHIKLGMQYATGEGLSFNSCLRLGFNPLCENVYDNNLIQSNRNKSQRKPKGQTRMNIPETLATPRRMTKINKAIKHNHKTKN
jgi:hypothetical protein